MLEFTGAVIYLPRMSRTLEKRVEELEHKLAELTNDVTARKPRKKDWQKTFGLSRGDVPLGLLLEKSGGRKQGRSTQNFGTALQHDSALR